MARNYQTKSNVGGLPDSITATRFGGGEFNSIAVELENAVESSDQTLAPADGTGEVDNQLAMALAIYGAGGAFYHADTGAVNAYVLTPISPKESPPAYFDGFTVIFEAGTVNTTASTVNVNSLGVKSITYSNGNALTGGELSGSCGIKYNSSDDRFELLFSSGGLAGLSPVYVIDSTQTDQGATSANSETLTIYDVATLVGTTKSATIYMPHNPVAGNVTNYVFDTSLDLSSYPYLFFKIDNGARFTRTTGDEVLTLNEPGNLLASQKQIITAVDMLAFSLGGTVRPEWFGAVADNVTDCADAIQYAIDSLPSTWGGVILFEGLTYRIASGLTITGNNIAMVGNNAATIVTNFAAGDMITIHGTAGGTHVENISVTGLNFTANTAQTSGALFNCYAADDLRFTSISASSYFNIFTLGVNTESNSVSRLLIRDCEFRLNSTGDQAIEAISGAIFVIDSCFFNAGGLGTEVLFYEQDNTQNIDGLVFTNNTCEQWPYGIVSAGAGIANCRIANNIFDRTAGQTIYFANTTGASDAISITGNIIYDDSTSSGTYGIRINPTGSGTINGLKIASNEFGNYTDYGIYIINVVENVVINGNSFTDSGDTNISIGDGVDGVIVASNVLNGNSNQNYGIAWNGTATGRVEGDNSFRGFLTSNSAGTP